MRKIVIHDGYNGNFLPEETVGTLTGNAGKFGRNGFNILISDDFKAKGSDYLTSIKEVLDSKPFKYVSLFSGIGGFEQALNKLGGTCVMASEIDKYANQAYEVLYGHPTVGDVTKVDAKDVPDHDILVGGFPCQSFSVAGKRGGFDDARGTLFFEMARIAKEKQPKVFLAENVKGLVSHDKGNTLDTIVRTLSDIGYRVDFDILNSKYFGVPQNRERIFIVAIREDLVPNEPWTNVNGSTIIPKGKRRISEIDGVKTFNFSYPEQTEVKVRLRDILESDVDERFYLSEEKTAKLVAQLESHGEDEVRATLTPDREEKRQNGRRFKRNDEPAFTLNTQDRHGVTLIYPRGLPIREATKKGYAIATEGDAVNIQFPDSETRRGRIGKQMANTLEASGINQGVVTPRYRIRKLTPRECFRLQGFPDNEFDKLTANGISNSQFYKMAGNAVTVNVISAIGKRLLPYLQDEEARLTPMEGYAEAAEIQEGNIRHIRKGGRIDE